MFVINPLRQLGFSIERVDKPINMSLVWLKSFADYLIYFIIVEETLLGNDLI